MELREPFIAGFAPNNYDRARLLRSTDFAARTTDLLCPCLVLCLQSSDSILPWLLKHVLFYLLFNSRVSQLKNNMFDGYFHSFNSSLKKNTEKRKESCRVYHSMSYSLYTRTIQQGSVSDRWRTL